MTPLSRALSLVAIVSLVAGCHGEVAGPPSEAPPAVVAVSKVSPAPDAMMALDACGITRFDPDHPGVMANLGIGVVNRMGLVTPGRDANRYAPLGNAREIKTEAPAWVIVTKGWIELPLAPGRLLDATCVVIAGRWDEPSWFATGGREMDGSFMTPFPQASPDLDLPTLGP